MEKPEELIKKLYSNQPIARFNAIMAKEATAIMGRGTGKTYGLHGQRVWQNAEEMPRCLMGLVNESYRKIFEFLLPPILKFLKSKGLEQDKHFFVRSRAPKEWGWAMPFSELGGYGNFIHLPNGSGIVVMSQDHNTTNNGANLDCLLIDEVRKLDKKRLAEDFPAVRGNAHIFKDSPLYGGRLYTTDMPDIDEETWVLDHRNHGNDLQNQLILQKSIVRSLYYMRWAENPDSRHYQAAFQKADREWKEARFRSAYYMEADSFENRYILGVEWYKEQLTGPDQLKVGPQIFTLRPQLGGTSFFPYLRKNRHTYSNGTNRAYLDGMDWNLQTMKPDSRWDDDIDVSQPLEICMDHNAGITSMIVHQEVGNQARIVKTFYVLDSELKRSEDLIKEFSQYYKHFPTRTVKYYWDTLDQQQDKRSLGTIKDDVIGYLRANGWEVEPECTGDPTNHVDRYRFFNNYMAGGYDHLPTLAINLENAEPAYESMKRTRVKKRTSGKQKFGIDKSAETDPKADQKYTTHFPEAIAKLFMYKYARRANDSELFLGNF